MAQWLARKTKTARHALCQRLAPKLFADFLRLSAIVRGVPRPMTLFLKDYMGDRALTGCEIGVARGVNAKSLCELLNIETLYLVDPYEPYQQDHRVSDYGDKFREAQQHLEAFQNIVRWLCHCSTEAIQWLPNKLDFVYIDGNHQYQHVKQDLRLYYEKVRHGGVIGGDDFCGTWLGVVQAVLEFANEKELDLQGQAHDFWFVKP